MRRAQIVLAGCALFGAGLVTGLYVQHRWPLGLWRSRWTYRPSLAPLAPQDIARLPATRRLVLVATGQSNAANYGEPRGAAGAGVYAFAGGRLFQAVDPLPGADGTGGSIWTRLGARLMATGRYDALVLAVVARGSTSARDWSPGGQWHSELIATLRELAAAGLPADFILWQQGETEGWSPQADGREYLATLRSLIAACHEAAPRAFLLVAQATYGSHAPSNAQIRFAQAEAATLPGTAAGPDLDTLDVAYRRDGIHFNGRGLEAAADLWLAALQPQFDRRARRSAQP
jgi:hypothetical protein